MKPWLIAGLLLGAGITRFQGPSRLANSIQDTKTEFLVYESNGNDMGLLTKSAVEPLTLDAHLAVAGGCCLHPATPSLSPDGQRVAYVHLSVAQPRKEAIHISDRSDHSEKEVFQANLVWSIAWSPTGDQLAVIADMAGEAGHNLYVIVLTTGKQTQLSHGLLNLGESPYTVSSHAAASWNGAGNKLAVELRAVGAHAENSGSGVVALWDTQTGEVHKLADGIDPSWSQAKDVIAFFETSRQRCFTVRPDGSEKKLLFALETKGFGSKLRLLTFPVVWSPDGSQLIFHQWVDADLITDIYRLDLRSGKPKFLARSEVQVVNWRETK